MFIDCARPANGHCAPAIRALRHSVLAEQCGLDVHEVEGLIEQAGSMAGMIAALGTDRRHALRPFHPAELGELEASVAERELLDPEEPAGMFVIRRPGRGLFRTGSLLSRAMNRMNTRRRRALGEPTA